jgi:hypothetical protein
MLKKAGITTRKKVQNGINRIYRLYKKTESQLLLQKAKRDFPNLTGINKPFFIIGVPGSLCVSDICFRFIPPDQPIVFVDNGLSKWESNWAMDHFKANGIVSLDRTYNHSTILDFLFDNYPSPFGILDFDCLVLNPSLFTQLRQIEPNTMINSVFLQRFRNMNVPETFILFLNTPVINNVRQKYGVTTDVISIDKLSSKVLLSLLTLGFNEENFRYEDNKIENYFDTMRLVYFLGLAEGYECKFLRQYPLDLQTYDEIFHIGAGHKTWSLNTIWNTRGTYFWRRSLESCKYPDLQHHYWSKYGNMSSDDVLTSAPDFCEKIGPEFFSFIEEILLR